MATVNTPLKTPAVVSVKISTVTEVQVTEIQGRETQETEIQPHALTHGSVYSLPYDDPEKQRLRRQHEALVAMMHNNPIHAPMSHSPKKIIDIGCGINADMTLYLAARFPTAKVYGIDLAPVTVTNRPSNVEFIQGNFLTLLGTHSALARGTIDFAYSRLLMGGMTSWREYTAAVAEVLAPEGWVEMHDFPDWHFYMNDEPEAVSKNWKWEVYSHDAVASSTGLDLGTFHSINEIMSDVGLENADRELFRLPWGKGEAKPEMSKFVEYGRAQWQSALTHVIGTLAANGDGDKRAEILEDLRETLASREGLWLPFYAAWAKKPKQEDREYCFGW